MNIAIVGYGGMGKMAAEAAKARGHTIVAIIDPKAEGATHRELSKTSLEKADVAIDFTHPSVILDNISKYCELGTAVVVGTTGWYDHADAVKEQVRKSGISFLWGSNFSVGVNAYFRIIEHAAKVMGSIKEYDLWAHELHHRNKADAPSGTAKSISTILLKNIPRKKKVVYEMLNRKIREDEFHFASVRGGSVNFEHTVGFDSEADCITLRHAARNRSGYAEGAVLAAEWLKEKGKGYFELDEFMDSLLGEQ